MVYEEEPGEGGSAFAPLDTISEERESAHPIPPNRKEFQTELGNYNSTIDRLRKRLDHLVGRNGQSSLVAEAWQHRTTIRRQREELFQQSKEINIQLEPLTKQIDEIRKDMKLIEPYLTFRQMQRVDQELMIYEEKYAHKMKNNREEKFVVSELDKLRRNKKKLGMYNDLLKKKGDIDVQIATFKLQKQELFAKQIALKKEQIAEQKKAEKLRNEASQTRQRIEELLVERKNFLSDYNQSLTDYTQWIKNNKKTVLKNHSFPATFPSAHKNICDDLVDVEELEPFYEQKRDCARLILYLEKLEQQRLANGDGCSHIVEDDSADEFPPGFARLNQPPTSRKKKGHSKKSIKINQPLSHVFDIYKLFGNLEIEAPKYYGDVPMTLEQVRARLVFFESQTVDMEWDEAQYGLGELAHDLARTLSTCDSGAFESETASVHSGRLYSSPTSPTPVSPLSRRDDGLGPSTHESSSTG